MSLLLERSATAPTDYAPTQTVVPPRAASRQVRVEPWGCVFVASVTRRRIMAAAVYDCVRFVIVRDGSVILTVLVPHITAAYVPPVEVRRDGRCRDRAVSRWTLLRPIRTEIRGAAELMRADLARQWRVADLAAHACLSSSQFERVFKEHYGLSPMAYLTMLRVQEMARLLRTTDLLVEQICLRVGWHNRPHTARHFRRYYGVPPTVYRRQGPHTASLGGPGAAVGQVRDEQAGRW